MKDVPEITDEKLDELRAKIRPVETFVKGRNGLIPHDEGQLYYIEINGHPRSTTFYLEVKAGKRATGLKAVEEITTHHSTGGFFFKPTEAEVLAQIPERFHDIVVAYEIIEIDMERAREHGESSARLQLYKKTKK